MYTNLQFVYIEFDWYEPKLNSTDGLVINPEYQIPWNFKVTSEIKCVDGYYLLITS
jgi:hypothetical protein